MKKVRKIGIRLTVLALIAVVLPTMSVAGEMEKDTSGYTSGQGAGPMYRNLYLEALGASGSVGVNYDSRFRPGSKWGYRVGLGYAEVSKKYDGEDVWRDASGFTVPLGVNGIFGKKKSFFEAGVGVAPMLTWEGRHDVNVVQGPQGQNHVQVGPKYYKRDFYCRVFLDLGYRYQRTNGFMLRAGINCSVLSPSVFGVGVIFPYLSLGYTFK